MVYPFRPSSFPLFRNNEGRDKADSRQYIISPRAENRHKKKNSPDSEANKESNLFNGHMRKIRNQIPVARIYNF